MTTLIAIPPSSLVVTSALGTDSTFPTLADLRHELADQLGTYGSYRVSAVATGGEPARYVLADELRDDEESRSQFAGGYVYAASGNQQGRVRRILQEGYEGPFGALRLSRPYDAALAVGTTIELTHPLPVTRHLAVKGLNQIIDEALERLRVRARIPLAGNGTRMYSLAAYPWLTRYEQTDGIYDYGWGGLSAALDPPILSPYPYSIRTDGATITLETGWQYATTATFYLSVLVPANRLIFDGTIWGYNPLGLQADTDQAAAPVQWVVAFGMVKGLVYLRRLTRKDKTLSKDEQAEALAEIAERLQSAGNTVKKLIRDTLPLPNPEAPQPMVVGPMTQSSAYPYGSNGPI